MDVDVNHILIFAVQTPAEHILQIHSRCLVAVAAVVNTLRVFILAGQERIGNGSRTIGDGGFAKAQVKAHLMPQTVADFSRGSEEGIHLGVLLVGSAVERIPVQNKIPVQIHVVFVVAAVVLHTVGIDVGNHQNTCIGGIQCGIHLFKEYVQHHRADVTFHTVDTGGQNDEVCLFLLRAQIERVDIQTLALIDGISGSVRAQIFSQLLLVRANLLVSGVEGIAVSIDCRTLRLAHDAENNGRADKRGNQHQSRQNNRNPQ